MAGMADGIRLTEWPDLSAYGMELVATTSTSGAPVLEIREVPAAGGVAAGAADRHAARLIRLGFERDRLGVWTRRPGRFVPRRFPLHLPLARIVARDPASVAAPPRAIP
jgi:hypothetical protein